MSLRVRRIIYLIFILIFVVITPLIILYTAGYRYNFKKNKIQKTGILILKSNPKDASIYLNNQIQKEKTPARIANLLPEDYSVRLEKENFYPWQKKLTVKSKLTTFAEDIILFKKGLPAEVKIGQINSISLSPDEKKLIYTTDQDLGREIVFLNLEDKNERIIYRASNQNEINLLEWDPSSKKILITLSTSAGTEKYLVLDTENPEKIDIYNNLEDFYFQFKNIEENKLLLANYNLIESSNKFITLIDKKKQSLAILDPASNETIFATEACGASWFPDGQKLLYFNDFELWVYDLNSDEKKLITRYSQKISDAKWYLNDNYILLLVNNSIKAIELDSRDIRNVTDLVKMDEIYKFEVNKKEEKIYLLGKIGEKVGIYELELE
jgi:WD40 repeat protein